MFTRMFERQITYFCSLYLGPDADISAFLDLLLQTNGAIIGSIARCILTFGTHQQALLRTVTPLRLDIVVPYTEERSLTSWRRFFSALGYKAYETDLLCRDASLSISMEHKVRCCLDVILMIY